MEGWLGARSRAAGSPPQRWAPNKQDAPPGITTSHQRTGQRLPAPTGRRCPSCTPWHGSTHHDQQLVLLLPQHGTERRGSTDGVRGTQTHSHPPLAPSLPTKALTPSHLSCPAGTAHPHQPQTSIASLNSSSGSASSASSTLPGVRSCKRFTELTPAVPPPLSRGGPTLPQVPGQRTRSPAAP